MPNGNDPESHTDHRAQRRIDDLEQREQSVMRALNAHNEALKTIHESIKLLTDGLGALTQTIRKHIDENR